MFNNIKRDWSANNTEPYPFNQTTAKEQLEHFNSIIKELEENLSHTQTKLKAKAKECAKLEKKAQDPVNKIKLKHLKKEVAELNSELDKAKNEISNLKVRRDFLKQDLELERSLDVNGYFGPSLLGRCISGIAQIAAIPVTLGTQLAARHPMVAAFIVLSIQAYTASAAAVTDGQQMNSTREQMEQANRTTNASTTSSPFTADNSTNNINATTQASMQSSIAATDNSTTTVNTAESSNSSTASQTTIASTTIASTINKLSPHAKFNTVKRVCEAEGLSLECGERMIKMSQSANAAQAGNASEYLTDHAQQFFLFYEKEILSLEKNKASLDKNKPRAPIPEPNQCESRYYHYGYTKLEECIRPHLSRNQTSLDNSCEFINQCKDEVKLTFQGEVKTLKPGERTPCFKAGIYFEDVVYQNKDNQTEKVVKATVKTAYSAAVCNLDGNYKKDQTVITRIDPKPIAKPVVTEKPDSPSLAKLKAECAEVSPLECAKKVEEALQKNINDKDLREYTRQTYHQFIEPVKKEIERLENQQAYLEEHFSPYPFESMAAQCDQSKTEYSAACVDAMVKLSSSKNKAEAAKANALIRANTTKFAQALEKREQALKTNLQSIEKCFASPQRTRANPNACESNQYEYNRYTPLESCINPKFDQSKNTCSYVNSCQDTLKISFNGQNKTIAGNSEVECFEAGNYTQNGESKTKFAGAFCHLNGTYAPEQAAISRIDNPTTAAPRTTKVDLSVQIQQTKQDCDKQTPLECADASLQLLENSNSHPEVCQYVKEKVTELKIPINKQLKLLSAFKAENKLNFAGSDLGKCESAKPYTKLDECLRPIFSCDEVGDNKCELVNECPEDLVITKGWHSRNVASGQKVPCFETGTYTDLNGRGELTEYKQFAGVYCSTTGEEDDPENHDKAYVEKMNQ